MTTKGTQRARSTYELENAEGGTSHTARDRVSEGHSQTGECRGSDESEHRKKTDRERGTHRLECAE
jgi:hypothetical protein